MHQPMTPRWIILLLGAFLVISGCRLADVMTQLNSTPTPSAQAAAGSKTPAPPSKATPRKTGAPTATSQVAMLVQTIAALQTQSWFPTAEPEETFPPDEPTEDLSIIPEDTPEPDVTETDIAEPANAPTSPNEGDVTETEVPTETEQPTETAQPTPEFRYQIVDPYCGPNWQTFVEGTLTEGGEPIDGLLVRISTNKGGDPAWTDYVSGSDPDKPGGYTQIIDAHGPREGLWYVWVVDPETNRRISDIATIKTDRLHIDDTDKSPGSCQSATINFSSDYPAPTPTEEPYYTATTAPTATRTRTGTPFTLTPTRTGTPRTATPTGTRTATIYTLTPTWTWTPSRTWTPTLTWTPTITGTSIPPVTAHVPTRTPTPTP